MGLDERHCNGWGNGDSIVVNRRRLGAFCWKTQGLVVVVV